MEIILATNNQGKVKEFKERLKGYTICSLKDKGIEIEIEEDGTTFEENAKKKARVIAAQTGILTMADDSGLEVKCLDNAPGIYSARYGGEGLDDAGRTRKLLADMEPYADRSARFVSVIALCYPDGREVTLRGECPGTITHAPKGEGGFGYDPVFFYAPLNKTFAELSLSEKNKISHRARALKKLEDYFNEKPVTIENDLLRATIATRGAEVTQLVYKKNEKQLLNTDLAHWNFTAPILFPILGRNTEEGADYIYKEKAYQMSPHGFARFCTFELSHISENTATFCLCENDETYKQYPFAFRLEITYTLEAQKLVVLYRVINTDSKELLFNIGGHEAYNIGTDYESFSIDFEHPEDFEHNLLTGQETPLPGANTSCKTLPLFNKHENNCITFFIKAQNSEFVNLLYKNEPIIRVLFEKDKTQSLGFWNQPNSSFFCIEPWSGIPDSLQPTNVQEDKLCINKLQPGEIFEYTHQAEFMLTHPFFGQ